MFFQSHWLLTHLTIVKTMDNGERGINPVTMTIICPRKVDLAEPWIEPVTCPQVRNATD